MAPHPAILKSGAVVCFREGDEARKRVLDQTTPRLPRKAHARLATQPPTSQRHVAGLFRVLALVVGMIVITLVALRSSV